METIEFILDGDRPRNTQATMLAALYHSTSIDAYRDAMRSLSEEIKANYALQKKPADDRITYAEACWIHGELLQKAQMAGASFMDMQLAVLSGFACGAYKEFPPRRLLDFTELKFAGYDEEKDNWINAPECTSITFNKYKTASSLGPITLSVPPILAILLRRLCALRLGAEGACLVPAKDYLFCTKTYQKLSPSTLNKLLTAEFGCSVDTLRSIFLSDMYKDTPPLTEMEDTAKAMGHSVDAALLCYVKK